MQAEIIALGTELTDGSKLDTNSQWLSAELGTLGVSVTRHTTIGDSMDDMVESISSAMRRADLVFITGGLGPTLDDLTRQAMADAAGVRLGLRQSSLDIIRTMFESRGRKMPRRNEVQAMFPEGAEPIPNPRGTAPGIDMVVQRPDSKPCRLIAMPGVPSEMKPMFQENIERILSGSGRVIRKARINCFGAGESQIEEMLGDLTARGNEPEVGITASHATITLRIVARGASEAECLEQIAKTREEILATLGQLVFGFEDEQLADVVLRQLSRKQTSVSVAETATAGRILEWLYASGEPDDPIGGGLVVGTGGAVNPVLPPAATESVEQLAVHCRELFATDYAIAVGELKGSAVEIGVSSPSGATTSRISVVGNTAIRQSQIAKAALNKLRIRLMRSD